MPTTGGGSESPHDFRPERWWHEEAENTITGGHRGNGNGNGNGSSNGSSNGRNGGVESCKYIPFSIGKRVCPGSKLAQTELSAATTDRVVVVVAVRVGRGVLSSQKGRPPRRLVFAHTHAHAHIHAHAHTHAHAHAHTHTHADTPMLTSQNQSLRFHRLLVCRPSSAGKKKPPTSPRP